MRKVRQVGSHRQRVQGATQVVSHTNLWEWVPELTGDPKPQRERQLSPFEQRHLRKQTAEWEEEGVVERTTRDVAWVNNIVFAAKKNGDIRVCVDCTPANQVTADLGWPLPRLQDVRARLVGANRLTRIDLRNAFFRISIPHQFRYLTAYRCDGLTYWFKKMPFGLKTAPETFQRMMDHVMAPHWATAFWYIDDILVWAKDTSELIRQEGAVIGTLEQSKQQVNYDKSAFQKQSLLFAGLWITPTTIGPNFDKVAKLLALPPPTNKGEAQSALGLASYLREFTPLASILTARITGAEVDAQTYSQEWGKFMTHLARTITTLTQWDAEAPADLYTDASKEACAAILIQNERIIAIASRKFTPAETRYSATDREHLGLILGCRKFRIFLQRNGPITTLWTDHKALLTRRMTDLSPRQARWRYELANSITDLKHVPGRRNPADFFSRTGVVDNWGPVLTIKGREIPTRTR